jgi:hypothetical protein
MAGPASSTAPKTVRTAIAFLVAASLIIEMLKRGYRELDHTHEDSPLHLPFHHSWEHQDPHALDDHVLPGVGGTPRRAAAAAAAAVTTSTSSLSSAAAATSAESSTKLSNSQEGVSAAREAGGPGGTASAAAAAAAELPDATGKQCNGEAHLELAGDVVGKWGADNLFDAAGLCCAACKGTDGGGAGGGGVPHHTHLSVLDLT